MPRAIETIVESHAEDAAFLYVQRQRAINAPHQTRRDLDRLDQRLEGHVDGLRVAGAWGRRIAEAAFERYREPGEAFVAAVLALESRDENRIDAVLDAAATPDLVPSLVSALGWVDPAVLGGLVGALLGDPDPRRRFLAAAVHSVHRIDPGPEFGALLSDAPLVRARALRLAGELGRADLIRDLGQDDDPTCRFWAAWSRARLSVDRGAPDALAPEAGSGETGRKALDLLIRTLPPADAAAYLRSLRGREDADRTIALGAGMLGDPAFVPWLLTRMRDPIHARVAGESFASITGVDLASAGLSTREAEDGDVDDERPEEDVAWDRDLPWPKPDAVRAWWRDKGGSFTPGARYFCGRRLDAGLAGEVLVAGTQRQRRGAALELAVAAPRSVLANCANRAPESLPRGV